MQIDSERPSLNWTTRPGVHAAFCAPCGVLLQPDGPQSRRGCWRLECRDTQNGWELTFIYNKLSGVWKRRERVRAFGVSGRIELASHGRRRLPMSPTRAWRVRTHTKHAKMVSGGSCTRARWHSACGMSRSRRDLSTPEPRRGAHQIV